MPAPPAGEGRRCRIVGRHVPAEQAAARHRAGSMVHTLPAQASSSSVSAVRPGSGAGMARRASAAPKVTFRVL